MIKINDTFGTVVRCCEKLARATVCSYLKTKQRAKFVQPNFLGPNLNISGCGLWLRQLFED